MAKLLQFATGCDAIPAMGFQQTPQPRFSHREDAEEHDCRFGYPRADTCALAFYLPVPSTYEDLKVMLTNLAQHCLIFNTE